MVRLTLAQMRRSLGRLAAAGLAIMIGAAFVTATLLSGTVITRTTYDAAAGQYGDADLVVSQATLDDRSVAAIEALPGVDAVFVTDQVGLEIVGDGGSEYVSVQARADDPRLEGAELTDGALPAGPGEVALPADLASRMDLAVGDTAQLVLQDWSQGDQPVEHRSSVRVVGLLATPSAFLSIGGVAVADPGQWRDWYATGFGGEQPSYWEATVALAPGTGTGAAIDAITPLAGPGAEVLTRDQKAARAAAELSGSTWVLTGVVLSFAAVSLLVASLVIANTFQVLVAQRTRTLALLRCVGAERSQLRRSVLLEATLVGAGSSVLGVLSGIGLVQAALTILGRTTDVPLPTSITLSWQAVVVPLLVGTAVTVLASLAPARAATRVTPLEALRPADPVHGGGSRVRAWLSGLLVAGGAAGLALGWVVAAMSMPLGLAVGVLGGAVSFVGVMVGAVFWVPSLLGRLGRLLGANAAGRLAAANAVRNPRRVATTSGALFIGVTLVAMMSTGAASVTRTFTAELATQYPVDVVVESVDQGDGYTALPASLVDQLATVDGVAAAVPVTVSNRLTLPGGLADTWYAADPASLRTVLAEPRTADDLGDGRVLLTEYDANRLGLAVGDTTTVTGPDGTADLVVGATDAPAVVLMPGAMATLDGSAEAADLWIRLAGDADAATVVGDLQSTASKQDALVQVIGLAVERAFFQRVVDTLLAVVVGLLGVAVVIAVVGVANTLSLSVLERRRESATLRAIGMTRGQLRGSLAAEGLMVALVGTVVGALLGVGYGFIGTHVLLAEVSAVQLAVPWRDLGLVLLVAVAAGLLASVLPARSATRTPPVEALAAE